MQERYLTQDLPGIGGVIKQQAADFRVEELPLYPPAGQGEHTFFEIQKIGLSTREAVRAIARALGVPPKAIGYAGLKDAQAITCQVLSVHRASPERVSALNLPGIQVRWAERHRQKLKIGHLRGNRFVIRVRDVPESALASSRVILNVLAGRGVPNRYGPQRFGMRGDSADLGRLVVRKDVEGFVNAFLGKPHPGESQAAQEARTHFDHGRWEPALDWLPGGMADERRALQVLIRTGGDHRRAYASVPKRLKVFLMSAYQSAMFNRVLDARLQTLDRVYTGDLAMKHPGHSVFVVEDGDVEQPRAERFEISPTGPIFGYKMMQARAEQGALEQSILEAEGLVLNDFRVGDGIRAKGARRALRFEIADAELSYDEGVVFRFRLPPGCYATAVLAELTKAPLGRSGM